MTDLKPGTIPQRLRLEDLGDEEPILTFRHRTQVVAQEDLMSWHRRSNVIAAVMTMALHGTMSQADRARLAFLDLEKLVDAEEVQRLSPLVFQVGKLDAEEQERIKTMKSTLPEPHFFKLMKAEGEAKGKAESSRETARKLLEHGVSWEIITSSTGIRPADLKKSKKK
ncbi:MAG: hypothetical protein IPN71_10305 [Fibrobacteres bacterium]|nr:hypothetical protein [Fibrobacterota bacterium]